MIQTPGRLISVGLTDEQLAAIEMTDAKAELAYRGEETDETLQYSDRGLLLLLLLEVRAVNARIEGIENDARELVSPENMARVAGQFLGDPDALMKMIQ